MTSIVLARAAESFRQKLASRLRAAGLPGLHGCSFRDVRSALREIRPPLVMLLTAPDETGAALDALREVHAFDRRLPVIVLAAEGSEALAVSALRAGVKDYLPAPFDFDDIVASVRRCLAEARRSAPEPAGANGARPFIGDSRSMRELRGYLDKVAPSDANVLITGETGTGKELVAEFIHTHSARARGAFISVNCAAIPETLLESELFGYERGAFTGAERARQGQLERAQGGTIFLDEIGDMNLLGQAKILRAIEGRQIAPLGGSRSVTIDVRLIAATNHDLDRAVAEGSFRKDLYYRLHVARIHLPPLRERSADIPRLVSHFVSFWNERSRCHAEGFTREALECLVRYAWPGNIRELRNLIEAIFLSRPSGLISLADLPREFRARLGAAPGLADDERERLLSALFATNWNKSRAAEQLHWSRMTLYRKMAKHHVTGRDAGVEAPRAVAELDDVTPE